MADQNQQVHMNSFPLLKEELVKRITTPIGQVSFWVFLVLGIIIFSAGGVWIELGKYLISTCKDYAGLQTAIFTFIPAIACPATMQIIYSDNDKKYLRSVGYFAGVLLLLVSIGLLTFSVYLTPVTSITWGVCLSIVSIFIWWVANGLDLTFYDTTSADAPTGGNPQSPLPGSSNGFRT